MRIKKIMKADLFLVVQVKRFKGMNNSLKAWGFQASGLCHDKDEKDLEYYAYKKIKVTFFFFICQEKGDE